MLARAFRVAVAIVLTSAAVPAPIAAQVVPSPLPSAADPSPSPSPQGLPSRAVSIEFHPPTGWRRMIVGGKQFYAIADSPSKVHMLSFSGAATRSDLDTYAADVMKKASIHGETIEGRSETTSCGGARALQFSVTTLTATGATLVTHYLLTAAYGGIGTAMYFHPGGVGDRQDGLDALATLCPGAPPLSFPVGWTRPKTGTFGFGTTATSPDLTSTFYATVTPTTAQRAATYEQRNPIAGTVIGDRNEPCLASTVHRIEIRSGGQIADVATAFVGGIVYRSIYTRPATHDVDPAADRALTGFCRPVDPNAPAPV